MIERKVLSEAFQEALEGRRLRAAVFLTFRFDPGFFEQEVLPIFFDIPMSHAPQVRLLHLEQELRQSGPVAVYFDRRALEAGAAPARTDFQRIGVTHRTGYFHPKNVLLLVDPEQAAEANADPLTRRTSLLLASLSANLTRAGWWENVEVAHIEQADADLLCGFRDDVLALISMLRRLSPEGTNHTALDEVHSFVQKLQQDPQRLFEGRLIPRLFTGDRDLPDFLEELAGNRLRGRCLEVISPYFDDKESTKPVLELMKRFRPRETRVFLPRGTEGEALCSETYWQAMQRQGATWATLPADIVGLSRDTERFVHAKVYRFFDPDDRRETTFIGSVNLTNAGFGKSGNVESGFLVEAEAKRKGEWWLDVDARRPPSFAQKGEADGLAFGPGANLVLRFDWKTGTARAFWDASEPSPPLVLRSGGVTLGLMGPVVSRQWTSVNADIAGRLKEHLPSSSFVTVSVEGKADAVILDDEEGSTHKPSLLKTLSPDEILQFWALLTQEQKQEFLEEHAGELGDEELALWIGESSTLPFEDGIFGTFAHIYLSFGNLERAVRRALVENRSKEAVDRLFGGKFDSLRRLVERIREGKEPNAVRAYVTLLCAIQLLDVLQQLEPEFFASERAEFKLADEARNALDQVKALLTLPAGTHRDRFLDWLERWFIRRASPPPSLPVA